MDKFPVRPKGRLDTTYDPERDGRIEEEGTPEVLKALLQQAQNVREGREDPNIRVALFVLPGAMCGVYGGGEVTAIHDLGLTDGFKVVIGGSTGAHTLAWLLAGNPRLGTSIFPEECTTSDFMRLKRLPDGYAMDVEFLSQIYRGEVGNKPLDLAKIKNAKPDFLIAVTKYETGEGVLLDGKEEPIIDKIQASSAAPTFFTIPIEIDGIRYTDGSAGAYFPFDEIRKLYNPTHVLVLTNRQKGSEEGRLVRNVDEVLSLRLPGPLRNKWLSREASFAASFSQFKIECKNSGILYLAVYPDGAIQSTTRDPKKLSDAAQRAEEHMRGLIESQKTD